MTDTNEEKKEEPTGLEKVYNDLNPMDIIHELTESTNIQASTHKKEAETNQLYAKANVLLVQTNNELSKNIIKLNNALSHAKSMDTSNTNAIKEKLTRIENQVEGLKKTTQKIETVTEKLEKLLPAIMEMVSRDGCTTK
ncbi:MAG TPA: hypothetical protein VFW07_11065 [Parafilimonas sp.]|nr:hypothetical protein [Parafilimonas sp.]